jgi:hypothetical protein
MVFALQGMAIVGEAASVQEVFIFIVYHWGSFEVVFLPRPELIPGFSSACKTSRKIFADYNGSRHANIWRNKSCVNKIMHRSYTRGFISDFHYCPRNKLRPAPAGEMSL